MKFTIAALLPLALCSSVLGTALQKRASKSWGGGNLYFLHGLSDSDQDYYIDTLAADGGKVVRLWGMCLEQKACCDVSRKLLMCLPVTGLSQGCQKGSNVVTSIPDLEPSQIGTYDDTVLIALDKVLAKLVAKGLKAIISPHDGNAYGLNSCDVYGKAYGCGSDNSAADSFYSSTTAKSQFGPI